MELDLNEFGKRYVTFKNYVFYGVITIGIIYIAVLFLGDDESKGVSFLAIQFFSLICLLLLPVGIILSTLKKTRKLGGAFLYFVAVTFLVYWWIAGLTLVHEKSGVVAAIIGIGLSVFTSGFGMFLVVVISAILHKSWSGVLIFIGFPMLSKIVMNIGLWLMEITTEQVKEKIIEFEEKQDDEIRKLEEKIEFHEIEQAEMESEIAEIDEGFEDEEEWVNEYYESLTEAELQEEIDYESLTEEELQEKIERLDSEEKKLEEELEDEKKKRRDLKIKIEEEEERTSLLKRKLEEYEEQKNHFKDEKERNQNELLQMVQEKPELKEFIFESLEELEIEDGTQDSFARDAIIEWRKGNKEKALSLFNNALDIKPVEALDLLNRGNLLIEMGKFDEGISDLEKARIINPELPTHLIEMLKIMSPEARENFRQHSMKRNNDEHIK